MTLLINVLMKRRENSGLHCQAPSQRSTLGAESRDAESGLLLPWHFGGAGKEGCGVECWGDKAGCEGLLSGLARATSPKAGPKSPGMSLKGFEEALGKASPHPRCGADHCCGASSLRSAPRCHKTVRGMTESAAEF